MKFGVVGVGGYWGPNWVRVLKQLGVLSAVCDSDSVGLEHALSKQGLTSGEVHAFERHEDLIAMDLDGVFVVTPPSTHAEIAVAAMKAGKHVFIEKPMASTTEDCYRIKFESERLDRRVMVGHTFVYHPAIRLFKRHLPEIGQLRSIYTVRANFGLYQDAGIVHDLMPHDFSIFTYLCDTHPEDVRAEVNPSQDVAYVSARYGQVSCSAFLSWSYPEKTRKLIAVGDQGLLEWDLARPAILMHRKRAERIDGRFKHIDGGSHSLPIEDESEPLVNEAAHFIECIRTGKRPLTSCAEGIDVVKGLESCG
jgi:predicted dehydrogenase